MLFFSGFGAAVGCCVGGSSVTGWEPAKRTFVACWPRTADYSGICDWRRKRLGARSVLFFQQMLGQGIAGILPKLIGVISIPTSVQRAWALPTTSALGRCTGPNHRRVDRSTSGSGTALASLSFSLTFVVILLIGLICLPAFSVGCVRKHCVLMTHRRQTI